MRVFLVLLVLARVSSALVMGKQRTDINMVIVFDRSESIDAEERRVEVECFGWAFLINALSTRSRLVITASSGFR